jgi:Bacterial Ig domain/PKD domain
MPNIQGIRENDWMGYLTTINAVETLTGYDFFANVPDAIENAIEAGVNGANPPGVANQTFTTSEDVAAAVTLNAAGSGTLTYTIVGSPAHGTLSGSGASQTYTPAPDYFGADSFTFKVSNSSGTSSTATVSITVNAVNDAPTAADDARSTNEDTVLSFAAYLLTSNDSAGPANESSQTMVVSGVAPTADTHGSVVLAAGMISYTPAANYNGPASFTYTVCDSGSLCATATVNVTVVAVNDAPTATLTAPATGVEGSAVSASVATSDIDAGDSSSIAWSVTKNGAPFANGTGAAIGFTPDDNGAYAISVTVTDAAGATGSDSKTVAVSNVAPLVTAVSGPTSQQALGSATTVNVVFSDAGAADTHSATFAWGDSTSSTVACAAGTCSATHTYAAAGVYSVSIVVSDDDGGIASAAFSGPVVYDADGASITGGGWVSTASGKANFTVGAQYLKNASVPTGNTKFELASGTLNSTSYDWLVVTGTTAQLQGTGTIGGTGSYGFLATATDNGNSDTIRIKVWDKTTGATVYDSGAALTVNGGNITIH